MNFNTDFIAHMILLQDATQSSSVLSFNNLSQNICINSPTLIFTPSINGYTPPPSNSFALETGQGEIYLQGKHLCTSLENQKIHLLVLGNFAKACLLKQKSQQIIQTIEQHYHYWKSPQDAPFFIVILSDDDKRNCMTTILSQKFILQLPYPDSPQIWKIKSIPEVTI